MRHLRPAAWLLFLAFAGALVAIPAANGQSPVRRAEPGTLAELIEAAEPGVILELAPGTYGTHQIHAKNDLTIRAEAPGTVVLTASSLDVGAGLSIANSTDISVAGLRIEVAKWGIGVRSSSNVSISDVTVSQVGQRGIWVHDESSNITIEDSLIERTGEGGQAALGEGIYLGNGTNPNDGTNTVSITGNTIRTTTAEGIDVKAGVSDVTVAANAVHDVSARTGAIAVHAGMLPGDAGTTMVSGNVVYNVVGADGDRGGSGIYLSTQARADGNVVFDSDGDGLEVRDVTGSNNQVAFTNNSIFQSGREDIRVPPPGVLPDPVQSGNGGVEQFDNFPDGWISSGEPTDQMWAFAQQQSTDAVGQIPTQQPSTTTTTPATTTTAPTTTSQAPGTAPVSGAFPVYDTAWQMLVLGTPAQADEYFATLDEFGFTGAWAGIIHHSPATYLHNYAGGEQVGRFENGEIVLSDGYISHVRAILDAADRRGQKLGLVAAWQNTYLPGGDTGNDELSNRVEGTLTTVNADAYGRQIAQAFGDHPAVSMWVFGGDPGMNNTEANKAVWRIMAQALRDEGMSQPITYHTATASFDHLNYVGEPWLDFVAPETGHSQEAEATEEQLRIAVEAYDVPVWQGESRYFNINFDWQRDGFQNPGRAEVVADAEAARRAGVSGYVYGDAGRWAWCIFQNGNGDTSPCDADNISASFGQAERDVIAVFR